MANEMELKVQELLNHLNGSYENMVNVLQSVNYMEDDTVTSKMATLVAIGLAKNYVAYLNGDFNTINEATTNAMTTAQKDLLSEEE